MGSSLVDEIEAMLVMARRQGMGVVRIKTESFEVEGAFKDEPTAPTSAATAEEPDPDDADAMEAYVLELNRIAKEATL